MTNQPQRIDYGDCFRRSWDVFMEDFGNFVVVGVLWLVVATFTCGILAPVAMAGAYLVAKRRLHGESIKPTEIFDGFNYFLPVFLFSIIVGIAGSALMMLFTITCVLTPFTPLVPVAIGVFYVFTVPFIVEQDMGFWEAMEASRKLVMADLGNYLPVGLIMIGLVLVGAMVVWVGQIFVVPYSVLFLVCAFEQVQQQPVEVFAAEPAPTPEAPEGQ